MEYLIERQVSSVSGQQDFLRSLRDWAEVATTGKPDVLVALEWPLPDFDDALQVAAAMACGARFIITRNERDFKKTPIPALSPDDVLRRHARA